MDRPTDKIESIAELEALYGQPGAPALRKVAAHVTPLYRKWIMSSRFCVVSTVGPDGTDGSPRGDDGPVVTELDPSTLLMPDWRGNNRLDTLRNIVGDNWERLHWYAIAAGYCFWFELDPALCLGMYGFLSGQSWLLAKARMGAFTTWGLKRAD